jgi:peptidoglycan/LPS O-acetylase OafA/YrhL
MPKELFLRRYDLSESANLDFLRSVAVLLVITDHLLEMNGHIHHVSFHPFDWYLGRLGVLIFFVHTSLVLMFSMQRSKLTGKSLFLNFYIRRAFRIYPLSILCVLLMVITGIPPASWVEGPKSWSLGTILANLFLVQNLTYSESVLAPLWSLPLEVQMYLVLPVIFVLLQRVPVGYGVAGLWGLTILGALVQPMIVGRLGIAQFAPCFVAGVIAYVRSSKRSAFRLLHWSYWPLFLVLLLATYIGIESIDAKVHHPPWLGWLVCLAIGMSLVYFDEIPNGILSRTSLLIARYSYGIYLFHMLALWIGFSAFADRHYLVQWLIFAASLILLPIASYHLIEKPLINYGNRFAKLALTAR